MADWWMYEDESRGWCPFQDSASLEEAFLNGKSTFENTYYKFSLPLMAGYDKSNSTNETAILLLRLMKMKESTKVKPWLFELAYGRYVPMSIDISSLLSVARYHNWKTIFGIYVDSYGENKIMHYNLIDFTQTNTMTGTIRTIIPAPVMQDAHSELDIQHKNIPDHMLCPITYDLMRDPVMAEDGFSYERSSIERWFSTGKLSSPITGKRIISPRLYSNHRLRTEIEEWIVTNG